MPSITQLTVGEHTLINVPADKSELLALGVDEALADSLVAEAVQSEQALQHKRQMRHAIHQETGDLHSLVGTSSDAICYLLYEQGKCLQALSEAQSLAEMRAAAAPLAASLGAFAQAVDAGEIQLPYKNKSTDVLDDVAARATGVAQILAAHAAPTTPELADE